MSRVKVDLPEQFLFSMEKGVGLSELNYAKHLDSVAMIGILHEARLQFLADLGFTESNIFGLGMVVTDMAVDYRAESFASDRLTGDVGLCEFNKYGVDICFKVSNTALETVVCRAKLGVVFFDFDKHQIAEVPGAFTALVDRAEAQVA